MSHFSNQLDEIIVELFAGQQLGLAKRAGLAQSILSRQRSGRSAPDMGTLEKILAILPEDRATALLRAFLMDQCPVDYRSKLKIGFGQGQPGKGVKTSITLDLTDHPPSIRDAILLFAAAAKRDPAAAEFLLSTSRFLSNPGRD